MNNNANNESIKTTREKVLKTLLEREYCSIIDLAESVDINPISVRHHIHKLEAEGLVSSIEEKHGVGRPCRMYCLSEKGREYFPARYLRLTIRLLQQLKDTLPKETVDQIFTQIAENIVFEHNLNLDGLSLEERLNKVTGLLNEEGFFVYWQQQGTEYHINEISCPYYHISQNHPEVCLIDQKLISSLLAVSVEKIACIHNGDNHCTYILSNKV